MFKRSDQFARNEQKLKGGKSGFSDAGTGLPLVAKWLGEPALG